MGLIEKQAEKELIKKIIAKHTNDTTVITTMNGCVVTEENVSFYMQTSSGWYLMGEEQGKKN
jgi:glucuronate isomerase